MKPMSYEALRINSGATAKNSRNSSTTVGNSRLSLKNFHGRPTTMNAVASQDSLVLMFRRGRDHHHRVHPFSATGLEQQWHIDHRDRCAGPFGIIQEFLT